MSDAGVVEAIGESARAENMACARRLAAIAELYERRQIPVEDGQRRELWRIDPWEAVASEVAAVQSITAGMAGGLMHHAICLRERLPQVAVVFATGVIDYRTVRMIVARTLLAIDPEVMAAIDAQLAVAARTWGPLSMAKMQQAVDGIVTRHDPDARRRTDARARGHAEQHVRRAMRAHASTSCSTSITRSTASIGMPDESGSESVESEMDSATGNIPRR